MCREKRDKREPFQADSADPEDDPGRKLCGLFVHMVTGVCTISNPIKAATLFPITISVKEKGAVLTRRGKVADWQSAS